MDQDLVCTRRSLLAFPATLAGQAPSPELDPAVVRRHESAVEELLRRQVTDPASPWYGGFPDPFGLHHAGSAAGALEMFTAAFLHPSSKFRGSAELLERMRLAAAFLERSQNPQGNIDLLITNFNSPPDTAFCVHSVARAALLARRAGEARLAGLTDRFLRRAMAALVLGGVHTPNHRWVVCQALAQLWELYREPGCLRRIDQWLAEGIDIDADGQYTERSTLIYNAVTNRALITVAAKLGRDELLDPVRRNLGAMLYLLHADGELVTEISRRQDQYQRGDASPHWFSLQYMAMRDRDGRFAALARRLFARNASLGAIMEYPELLGPLPPDAALPQAFEREFPGLGIARIRRGPVSATIFLRGSSRLLHWRRGEVVVEAVRLASAFFGKGQFVPQQGFKRGDSYVLSQSLEGDYLQPLDPPRRVGPQDWSATRALRRRSQTCRLEHAATITETARGFRLHIRVSGTQRVPAAVEINLRAGGKLEGVAPAPQVDDGWLFAADTVRYRAGDEAVVFGPGLRQHAYTQIRMAEPKLPGPSVYLTGYSPLDHTLEFRWEKA
ncbi:MAG: hypothetical protein ACP5U2_07280 [Bryobacteraceae bacterium]